MGETVAIISVAASAFVGVSGVLAAAFSGMRERRWRTKEERVTELRGVLENAGSQVTRLLLAVEAAHGDVMRQGKVSDESLTAFYGTKKEIALAANRVGVRRGSQAREYLALGKCWSMAATVGRILERAQGDGLGGWQAAYESEWKRALDAEQAYLDAAAATLSAESSRKIALLPRRQGDSRRGEPERPQP